MDLEIDFDMFSHLDEVFGVEDEWEHIDPAPKMARFIEPYRRMPGVVLSMETGTLILG
jgi:hypothetical protein